MTPNDFTFSNIHGEVVRSHNDFAFEFVMSP